jgi:hypothetical protein
MEKGYWFILLEMLGIPVLNNESVEQKKDSVFLTENEIIANILARPDRNYEAPYC